MGRDQYTAKQFIDAINGSGGIITAIAQRVGCTWNTAKKYIDTHSTVREAYDAECERIGDIAESVLIRNIRYAYDQQEVTKKPVDSADVKWYISKKLKDRGYVERQELSGPAGGPIETRSNVNLSKLTDEELDYLNHIASRVALDSRGEGAPESD